MAEFSLSGYWTYLDDYVSEASSNETQAYRATNYLLRNFCRFTHCWKQTLADISVVADTKSYALTTTATDTDVAPDVIGVDQVLYKESGADDDQYAPLELKAWEWLQEYDPTWYNRGTAPVPHRATFNHVDGKLYLINTPSAASSDGLSVRVIVIPDKTATTLPGWIFETYWQTILYGVAAVMMRMPGKRWSNAQLGDKYWTYYMEGRDQAQQDIDTGYMKLDDLHVIPEGAFTGGSRNSSFPTGTGIV